MRPVVDDIKNMLTTHKSKTVPLKDLVNDTLKTINNRIVKLVQTEVFGDIVNNKYAKMFSQQAVQQVPIAPQPKMIVPPQPVVQNAVQPVVQNAVQNTVQNTVQPAVQSVSVASQQEPQQMNKQSDVMTPVNPNVPTFGGSVFMNGKKIEISCRMTGN
jgi:hypothetical protein